MSQIFTGYLTGPITILSSFMVNECTFMGLTATPISVENSQYSGSILSSSFSNCKCNECVEIRIHEITYTRCCTNSGVFLSNAIHLRTYQATAPNTGELNTIQTTGYGAQLFYPDYSLIDHSKENFTHCGPVAGAMLYAPHTTEGAMKLRFLTFHKVGGMRGLRIGGDGNGETHTVDSVNFVNARCGYGLVSAGSGTPAATLTNIVVRDSVFPALVYQERAHNFAFTDCFVDRAGVYPEGCVQSLVNHVEYETLEGHQCIMTERSKTNFRKPILILAFILE